MKNDVYVINESGAESLLENISLAPSSPNGLIKLTADCTLQSANTPNKNKRVYSSAICEGFVESAREKMRSSRNNLLLGECNHPLLGDNPDSPASLKRQLEVRYDHCCVGISNIGFNGTLIESSITFLSNGLGQDMAKLVYYDGVVPGMSCRALGKTTPSKKFGKGITEVCSPCVLVTWDMVENPSHTEARMVKVTNAIRNPRGLNESSYGKNSNVVLDESSTVLSLRNIFLNDDETNSPLSFLIESLLYGDSDNFKHAHSLNKNQQKKFIECSMNRIINEFIETTPDTVDGVSSVDVLNESNVTDFLHDYCHNKKNYDSLKKTEFNLRKFLDL